MLPSVQWLRAWRMGLQCFDRESRLLPVVIPGTPVMSSV